MQASPRRSLAVLLVFLVPGFILSNAAVGVQGARPQGVCLSGNGYRSPIYGISRIHDAGNRLGTSCARLTQTQVDAARVGGHVSRAMLAQSPHVTVQATSNGATFEIV